MQLAILLQTLHGTARAELTRNGAFNLDASGNVKLDQIEAALVEAIKQAEQRCVALQLSKEIKGLLQMKASGRFITHKVID